MDIKCCFLPGDGCMVPVLLVKPTVLYGVAVVVHGYGGNKEEQLRLGLRVAEKDLFVCVIDLCGNGSTPSHWIKNRSFRRSFSPFKQC
jgi:hypothetical protein